MRKFLFLFTLIILGLAQLNAADVSFKISAPQSIVVGQQFRLQYELRGGSGTGIEIPEFIDGFDLLYGPSVSTMHSSSFVNGKHSSESSTTYSYVLEATKAGNYTMPAASIKADGKSYTSNTSRIQVLPPDKNATKTEPGRQPQTIVQKSKGTVDPNDAFIRTIFSKTRMNEQEAVVVTFRFYTVLNISSVGKIEFPEFEGFMVEDFDIPVNVQWQLEHYNGRNYMMIDVKKSLLFPQRSGEIIIPSGNMDIVFEISSGKTLNHPLYGPQEIMTEQRKKLTTSSSKINVSALPSVGKPLNFSGGVGNFTIKSTVSSTDIKANDAITVKIDISGQGNMKLIREPELNLNKNFEQYDPKVENKFSVGASGLSGTKSIEYLLIPRYPGKYTIPALEFSYFDLKSRTYKTLKTEAYNINVAVDPNAAERTQAMSYANQSEVKVEQDIRYLKLSDFNFAQAKDFSISKFSYLLWYIIPLILFATSVIVYRKQIQANADIARMKTKRANREANRRLKLARKHLDANNKDGYYEELLRAVWGYLSDKLTIAVVELNRENVEIELGKYGASEELIREYIEIIDTCEFARYAPSQDNEAMDSLYNNTEDAIAKMEDTIKTK